MTRRTAIAETNAFLERFITYRSVFQEYFKTMHLIESGEVLKYETYQRLTNNFLLNVKIYNRVCWDFIEKQQLVESKVHKNLDNYFIKLVKSVQCMNPTDNQLDHKSLKKSQIEIDRAGHDFVTALSSNLG
ncbi:hypothetical protein [Companilactobacillus versmoldensis]|uniref:Uncharacterized protein n=1 Tax=Companilactobacillus versmoldensis DSM 14857 = KCTC 3814 TaxID=1423815 RepID=A0A0R1SH61_9LACO|nr:hypothetical protein [Companilactobacillus versmoldensis]KRL68480.1 hypothetical protein FC27_GL000179 [Companilactobacillus versmoldensis DSM 14857 = KCTC 3814]